jgi:hypothetical protein
MIGNPNPTMRSDQLCRHSFSVNLCLLAVKADPPRPYPAFLQRRRPGPEVACREGKRSTVLAYYVATGVTFTRREHVSSRRLRVDMSTRRARRSGRSRQWFVGTPRCDMENDGERHRDERDTSSRLGTQRLVNCHGHLHTRSCLRNLTLAPECERASRASHATGARRRSGARASV